MYTTAVHTVLVIDDDRDDYDLVAEAIGKVDPLIDVHYLDRCEDAHRFAAIHFDLVLLDINMPLHDGFSWLQGIRKSGYERPIVMYTNSASPAHIVRAYDEGATLYFTKPESYSYLLQGMRKLLHLDWSNPLSIRDMHLMNGEYQTFQVARSA